MKKYWISLNKHFNKLLFLLVCILSTHHGCTCKNLKDEPQKKKETKETTSPCILEISQDPKTGNIVYKVTNPNKGSLDKINLHYQCITPGVQLAGKSAHQIPIGPINGGATTRSTIGSIDFSNNEEVEINFWLELSSDTTHYSSQTKMFKVPIRCRIEVIGPHVQYNKNGATWICKIEPEDPKQNLDPSKIKLEIQHIDVDTNKFDNSSKPILTYGQISIKEWDENNPVIVSGTGLKDIKQIEFSLVPDNSPMSEASEWLLNDEMFVITLKYDDVRMNEKKLIWYKEETPPKNTEEAVRHKDVYAFRKFVEEKKPYISAVKGYGTSYLFNAIELGDKETVQELINAKVDVNAVSTKSWGNTTPLFCTFDLEIAKLLIDNNADVNFANQDGETHLFNAIRREQVDLVKLLLERSARKDLPNKKGETPTSLAQKSKNIEIKRLLGVN
jgi:hypothetical protein